MYTYVVQLSVAYFKLNKVRKSFATHHFFCPCSPLFGGVLLVRFRCAVCISC